ncbi:MULTISPECIES: tRNA epoxyqueuosine(34) reductase QueG [unclassified Ectothiorhodospira]|uniref:tRNA epoxyqueuosine(34) reductase QueG n=1 Tax=unclassified Ectothiorhodospira TaxID=2684909 RepID=UPI001EE856F5|nr:MULTISPECIES: tRNA epoxyqueuosine(34) reductase QueG [unclassified Ectothiorhodospira]MCG5516574.1 tRNA epoxyqueuosine(34) reductase QueG [Ectothiorhodospira sp. 9100]MCG5518387.1 tRNA epoxyqueuosine(34) reductase QueG [Ectothiorhodospira sp. 9905]
MPIPPHLSPQDLADQIKTWGRGLGFDAVGISDTALSEHETHLLNWLAQGRHGTMNYMERHGTLRSRPPELVPGTLRIISVRMQYLPAKARDAWEVLERPEAAFITRYALGRDYHKLIRRRLQTLASRMEEAIGPFGYRAFVDSAPVLEKALAEKAGLGWIGKHTNLLSREAGSWFFLGELYTDLPLPVDPPGSEHCGRCRACLDVCPTGAIVAPFELDARLCISYLTIEHPGPIPEPLRPLMGNRIYGCDDCQLVCPWNRRAALGAEPDFEARHGLDDVSLVELFAWDEATFLKRTEGSAIRRIGHERWLRNLAVALGNAGPSVAVVGALEARLTHPSELVREHVVWGLERQVS